MRFVISFKYTEFLALSLPDQRIFFALVEAGIILHDQSLFVKIRNWINQIKLLVADYLKLFQNADCQLIKLCFICVEICLHSFDFFYRAFPYTGNLK